MAADDIYSRHATGVSWMMTGTAWHWTGILRAPSQENALQRSETARGVSTAITFGLPESR